MPSTQTVANKANPARCSHTRKKFTPSDETAAPNIHLERVPSRNSTLIEGYFGHESKHWQARSLYSTLIGGCSGLDC
jgi:hypothetical protein